MDDYFIKNFDLEIFVLLLGDDGDFITIKNIPVSSEFEIIFKKIE